MPKRKLRRIQKQLGLSTPRLLVVGAILLSILVIAVVAVYYGDRVSYKLGLKTRPSGPDAIPYWEETTTGESFVWQPKNASYSSELLGEKRIGNNIKNGKISPGFQLVQDGYTKIDLEQNNQTATQASVGFQKGDEVCVLTTSLSDGQKGLLENTPDLNYVLVCGNFTQN